MPLMPEEDRTSHGTAIACLCVLLAAVCALHAEVLFGGHVYHMDDAADGYYPGHIAVMRAFAHGQLPIWERGSWAGWPLVVDPYNGVFYPLNVIYYLFGAARGLGYAVALHCYIGGAGMWLLARRRGLGALPALFAGLAYELSSFGVVRIRHVIFVQMIAWLPWILVGVEGWLRTRRPRELALLAGATGLALVAGALSIGHFAALSIGAYTVARAIPGAESTARVRRFLLDTAALGGAAIVGALIAAAQILPTIAHLPYSPRALGSDYRFASSYAWPAAIYALSLLAPDYFGGENRAGYVGAPNHWELCGWYVGALVVVLAPLAMMAARDPRRRGGPERYVLFGLVLLAMGLAFGDAGPVHPFFYKHVPLYAALRCPARALLMALLALPILGAEGLATLLDRVDPAARAWALTRGTRSALLVGAVVLSVIAVARAMGVPRLWAPFPASVPALDHLEAVLIAGGALALLAFIVPTRVTAAIAVILCGADLLWIDRAYVATQHQPDDYPSGMERFAAVDWLLANHGPIEADGDGGADRFVNDPSGPFRLHNVGMVLGMENASGYDSVPIWRYVEFLHILKTGHRYPYKVLRDDFAAIGVHNLGSRLLDLMNVRWLLAGDPPDARWKERFRPSPPTGSAASKYEPWWDPRMKVFENTTVLPRAFVVHRFEVPGSDDRLAARLASSDFDPARVALLEEAPATSLSGVDAPMVPALRVAESRSRLHLETDDPLPGILIVSDAHYPGWRVWVDGAERRLLRADFAFRGVALTAGRHRIEMQYRSRPTEAGLLLSIFGITIAVFLALLDGERARRARSIDRGPARGRVV